MNTTNYYFLPSVRQGLATAIIDGAQKTHRVQVTVNLHAKARKIESQVKDKATISKDIQLYGPGDILGFHERIVSRCYPTANVGDSEPNYFPLIEFADTDFAWRFTPTKANENGALTPWITLLVFVSDSSNGLENEFTDITAGDKNLPRRISVNRSAIPYLNHAHRWAHGHITEKQIDNDDLNTRAELESSLRIEPEKGTCRLICPRRLAAKTKYRAFVVPTFKLGVLAGLGYDLDSSISGVDLAWKKNDSDKLLPYYSKNGDQDLDRIILPYYYSWEFGTGLRGDFEHLVRLLEPRALSGLGTRDIDCQFPGYGVHGVNREGIAEPHNHYLGMEGALKSVDTQYTPWGRDPVTEPLGTTNQFQLDLEDILNKPKADQDSDYVEPVIHSTHKIDIQSVNFILAGTAVEIKWKTQMPTSSKVEFGETSDYDRIIEAEYSDSDAGQEKQYLLVLDDLNPDKAYHFKVLAADDDGNEFQTPDCSFTMPPLPWVVPPIYGRWYRGRDTVEPQNHNEWLDVLNLDPRHRTAAGLGTEVIRKQQEPLMAEAWEQLGAIESANDILRRSQFGRDTSNWLFKRLGNLTTDVFLAVTSPVQSRVILDAVISEKKITAKHFFATQSAIPEAAFEPTFRKIMRPRGPIRKRQGADHAFNLYTRFVTDKIQAAGQPPKPSGTVRLCDISKQLTDSLIPEVTLSVKPTTARVGESVTLTWSSSNAKDCMASIGWSGTKGCSGSEEVVPFPTGSGGGGTGETGGGSVEPGPSPEIPTLSFRDYKLTCAGPFGVADKEVRVDRTDLGPGSHGGTTLPEENDSIPPMEVDDLDSITLISKMGTRTSSAPCRRFSSSSVPIKIDTGIRFCDSFINCDLIANELKQNNPFENVQGAPDANVISPIVCDTLDEWLEQTVKESGIPQWSQKFLVQVKENIRHAINPKKTVLERTKKRLKLTGKLDERFEEGAKGDPLDILMIAPEFPQPMYEPLRDISHDLLLPGVEKVPQNTLGVLLTNRRFIESYLCGDNHEFARELLWRGYPTDQRGSYFRQFWDVSGYVPRENKLQELFDHWLNEKGYHSIHDLPEKERNRTLRRYSEEIENISDLSVDEQNVYLTQIIKEEQLEEELKDVTKLVSWQSNKLGHNSTRASEDLVLVVRGDLLQRYPNALIYAIDAVPCDGFNGKAVPAMREYLKEKEIKSNNGTLLTNPNEIDTRIKEILNGIVRVFPVFQATLPPDITFFGLPFSEEDARGDSDKLGKYFIIEEQVSEPRFGLDMPTESLPDITAANWPDDLSWSHFGFGVHSDTGNQGYGEFLNEDPSPVSEEQINDWNMANSARFAWLTMQKPVRIAVHAKQMIPDDAKYFEIKGSDSNDRFVIKILDPEKIEHARNILSGKEIERIHIKGVIVAKPAPYNPGWNFHLNPDSIDFFKSAANECDTTMRYIEDHLEEVGHSVLPDKVWCRMDSELMVEIAY